MVTNPSAGTADDDAVAAALAVLRASADVEERTSASPDELAGLLADAGERVPVLVGGDGSLHLAVAALHAAGALSPDRPLGLLPRGTGNDMARTLGLPRDPAEAARVVLAGRPRPLDLLVDDAGGVVVNAVHLGVGAEAAARAEGLKDAMGMSAYTVGSAVAGLTSTGWRLTVEADGSVVHDDEPALMVGIANGRTIGGGSELAPEAEPDDGLLDVVIASSVGPLARLGFGVALREGEHVSRDDVRTARARTVSVHGEPFPVNADGEVSGPVPQRTWTVRPRAWSLLCP